jgi:hypothetical protein
MNDCSNLTPQQLLVVANIIALALSEGRSSTQLNILGNFIVAVGSLILTFAAQVDCINQQISNNNSPNNNSQSKSKS